MPPTSAGQVTSSTMPGAARGLGGRRLRPGGLVVGSVALALVVGVGGGWASKTLLTPPPPLPSTPSYVLAKATQDTVQRQISLGAKATWAGGAEIAGGQAGTVTRVWLREATRLSAGQVVYDVDLKPVVVGEGLVPSFRDLKAGDRGEDVRQLQRLLRSVHGDTVRVDGTFGAALGMAVKSWQESLGRAATGTVDRGSLLFVPRLPAVVTVDPDVRVGAAAPVGSAALRVLPATPSFSVVLPTNQASLTKVGMRVRLTLGSAQWSGRITRVDAPSQDGSAVATIGPAPGATSVCGDTCQAIPVGGATVSAAIEVVPATAGVTVPSQALVVGIDGGASVVDAAGRSLPVTVKATAGGVVVVDGLDEGREVRVPTRG